MMVIFTAFVLHVRCLDIGRFANPFLMSVLHCRICVIVIVLLSHEDDELYVT